MRRSRIQSFQSWAVLIVGFAVLYSSSVSAKTRISAEQVEKLSIGLCQKVAQDFTPDVLIGLSRGGVGILIYFSGEPCFDNPQTRVINAKMYNKEKEAKELQILSPINFEDLRQFKKILVIDELVDTGGTIKGVVEMLKKEVPGADIRTAVLFDKPLKHEELGPVATYHMLDFGPYEWIVMPWEKPEPDAVLLKSALAVADFTVKGLIAQEIYGALNVKETETVPVLFGMKVLTKIAAGLSCTMTVGGESNAPDYACTLQDG